MTPITRKAEERLLRFLGTVGVAAMKGDSLLG
jgi:hypothetical protein